MGIGRTWIVRVTSEADAFRVTGKTDVGGLDSFALVQSTYIRPVLPSGLCQWSGGKFLRLLARC